jgi:hypothetical protein
VAALGDVDGNGTEDYSVSNSQTNSGRPAARDGVSAYLVLDYVPEVVHPRDVGVTVHYDLPYLTDRVAISRIDDINGDGYDDVAVTATGFLKAPEVKVLEGPLGSDTDLSLAKDTELSFFSSVGGPGRWFGFTASLGDWNGDGLGALAIADPGFTTTEALAQSDCESNGCRQGAIYILAEPVEPGAHDLAEEADRLEGAQPDAYLGGNRFGASTLAAGSDLNDDGFPDLAFTASAEHPHGPSSGSAYVLFGGGSP